MSDIAIRVEKLSKRYRIGGPQVRYKTLRESIMGAVAAPLRYLRNPKSAIRNQETIWALKDVSFEVKRGEVVGVIGRNGAGKSTLLKILSRITEPTEGYAEIHGRVGSLLEVGTGFHPELTGRENVYLNGAILGMKRVEIDRKFDEIVAFAEIEKFLDTPVKHYSSGMHVRLAFAVAAHLEPEILLVDEVLAVGDAAFQKKCLGKMEDVAREGRTVLFVSHNMAAIQGLCRRAILLDHGAIAGDDVAIHVIELYLQSSSASTKSRTCLLSHEGRRSGSEVIFGEVCIFTDGRESTVLRMGGSLRIVVSFKRKAPIPNMRFGIAIEDHTGQRVVNFSPSVQAPDLIRASFREGTITCDIPCLHLLPGLYYVTLILATGSSEYLDRVDRAVQFTVEPWDVFGTGQPPKLGTGIFYEDAAWHLAGS
jgi:lipopolysaccharide transport system ATP-binding protein